MLSRRSFIKGLVMVPIVACIPPIKPKPKPKPMVTWYRISLDGCDISNLCEIPRKMGKTDTKFRERILNKIGFIS